MTTEKTPPSDRNGEPGPDADAEDIQADIEKTRQELGQTVEALVAKADVKGRAEQKVSETKERLADKAGSVKPGVPVAALIAVGVVVLGALLWRRRHR